MNRNFIYIMIYNLKMSIANAEALSLFLNPPKSHD